MEPNQQTTQLLHQTIDTFNGGVQTISPTDGVSLIDNWISALHSGDASTNPIASTLNDLKIELQRGNPDSETIRSFLDQLSTQAKHVGETATGNAQSALDDLSEALQSFSQQLSGQSGPAKAGSHNYAGNTQGGGSYGSGYGTGSEGQDGTPNSGMSTTSNSTTADNDRQAKM
jgi:hypothetical protein